MSHQVISWRTSTRTTRSASAASFAIRSEEHTSELQSRRDLVCRLLLENNKELEFMRSDLPFPGRDETESSLAGFLLTSASSVMLLCTIVGWCVVRVEFVLLCALAAGLA